MCTVGQSFQGFNSGTSSSFIYHPAGRGEHARGCSKMKVCESAFHFVQTQRDKRNLSKVCEIVFFLTNKMQYKMLRYAGFNRSQGLGGMVAEFVQLMLFPECLQEKVKPE